MNWWSVFYLYSFILFIFLGIYGWNLNRKAIINKIFLKSSAELGLWSLGYGMMLIAKDAESAMIWRAIYLLGGCLVYSSILMACLTLINYDWVKRNFKYTLLLLVIPLLIVVHYANPRIGKFVRTAAGWNFVINERKPALYLPSLFISMHHYQLNASKISLNPKEVALLFTKHSLWLIFFNLYYFGYMIISVLVLLKWRRRTALVREQKQASTLMHLFIWTTCLRAVTDITLTCLSISGEALFFYDMIYAVITQLAVMWVNYKYQLMYLTQEIAANHVLQTMMESVLIVDNDLMIREINPVTSLITGYSKTELLGKKLSEINKDQGGWQEFLNELTQHNSVNAYRLDFITKDGEEVYLLGFGVRIFNEYQEELGSVLVLHDITQQKLNEDLVREAHQKLQLKIFKLQNVFDNIDQGILTIGRDLLIQAEYSLECERLFGMNLTNRSLTTLLYPNDLQLQASINQLLRKLFELDEAELEVYLPLLPKQVVLGQQTISLKYKLIQKEESEMIMLIVITDITAKLELEKKMERERKNLKMVVKIVLNHDLFLSLVHDYQIFVNQSNELSGELLLRQLRIFRCNFSQYFMLQLVERLACLEEALLKDDAGEIVLGIKKSELWGWLQEELELIENYVGKDFFLQQARYCIEKERLEQLEQEIKTNLNLYEAKAILPLIISLRYKGIHELLEHYADYTMKLAERLEKGLKPLVIKGDQIFVDERDYRDCFKVLVHLFRNAVDHALETEIERMAQGKPELGEISCEIRDLEEYFQIIIADDGRGIDLELLEQKALEKGFYNEMELLAMNETEKLELIFLDQMSCKEIVTSISGRGVGLAAVKATVIAAGGYLGVESCLGQGTRFTITLPKKQSALDSVLSSTEWMEEIIFAAKELIFEQSALWFEDSLVKSAEKIDFNEITALSSVKGVIDGLVMFSFNQVAANQLFEKMILIEVSEEQRAEYLNDAVCELINTILGNTMLKFEEMNCFMKMGLPTILSNSNGYLKNLNLQLKTAELFCKDCQIKVGVLLNCSENEIEVLNELNHQCRRSEWS